MEKLYCIISKCKETDVITLVSHKEDFKTRNITKENIGNFIIVKDQLTKGFKLGLKINNVYMLDEKVSKCMKQKLTKVKRETEKSVVIRDF